MVAETHDLRSFGRRRGRRLSERQQRLLEFVLPPLRLDLSVRAPCNPSRLFDHGMREVWLEIGFGGGENLLWQAEHHPDIGLIGCEPFEEGIVKVLSSVEERHLSNIRLWPDDARSVLRWLPPSSLSRVFVLFPDPWPKRRHQKRRLLSSPTLALVERALMPGGVLNVATDIPDYTRSIFMALTTCPQLQWTAEGRRSWRERPQDWPSTRYEQKATREGRQSYWLEFVKSRDAARRDRRAGSPPTCNLGQ